jgi:ubiquinone/menaquinone biosynthesis C-methylase UbiE
MAKKLKKDAVIEGRTAYWYARQTKSDMVAYNDLAKKISGFLKKGDNVLEVAPGPGYAIIKLAKMGDYNITGMDLSIAFVEIGKKLAQEEGVKVQFRQGNVINMPFENKTFDFIYNRAAFKNFKDPVGALNEMFRVLKIGGKILIEDLKPDTKLKAINELVNKMKMNFFNKLLTKFIFYFGLRKTAHSKEELEEFILHTEYKNHKIVEGSLGYEIWLYK